jgi:hypothetical protein
VVHKWFHPPSLLKSEKNQTREAALEKKISLQFTFSRLITLSGLITLRHRKRQQRWEQRCWRLRCSWHSGCSFNDGRLCSLHAASQEACDTLGHLSQLPDCYGLQQTNYPAAPCTPSYPSQSGRDQQLTSSWLFLQGSIHLRSPGSISVSLGGTSGILNRCSWWYRQTV